MNYTILCEKCFEAFIGRNEYEADKLWGTHKCNGNGDVELELDILKALALGKASAWPQYACTDRRK